MRIITSARLKNFYEKHPDAKPNLQNWNQITNLAKWQNFAELRETYPSADRVGELTVFNISGNKYRLITYIDFKRQKLFIRSVLTHAEYDKEAWKNDPWFKKI